MIRRRRFGLFIAFFLRYYRRWLLLRLAVWCGVLVGCAFASVCVWVVVDGRREVVKDCDAAVILGNTVYPNGTPTRRLMARLDRALELYKAGRFPKIIVSGGVGAEGPDEAVVMRTYLTSHGVPAEAIITDSQGLNTYLTAQNTKQLMQENGWKRVCIVSQFYHLPRCRLAFKQQGLTDVASACPNYIELRDLYSVPRDAFGFIGYSLWEREPSREKE
jgi:uncharacterized SAM-binding protein YcdF (DUF218 family)